MFTLTSPNVSSADLYAREGTVKISKTFRVLGAVVVGLLLITTPTAYGKDVTLKGAGSSAAAAYVDACKAGYQTATGDSFSYSGTGSGDGKKAIDAGTHDFAFSDSKNSNPTKKATMIHIPALAWPVAVMYNLNQSKQVVLSVDTVAKIFARKITKWNDPQIVADNNREIKTPVYKVDAKTGKTVLDRSGNPVIAKYRVTKGIATMPAKDIVVIYRSGNSGTSNNFTTALNKSAPTVWTKNGNDSFATAFPGDPAADAFGLRAAAASSGVGQLAKDTKYSITYNEVFYAKIYGLKVAGILNPAGNVIQPGTDGVLSAFSVADINDNGEVNFNYTSKLAGQYPFASTTYALALTDYGNTRTAKAVKEMIEYHAFTCPTVVTTLGFAQTSRKSYLGKVILKQLAKLGK